MALGPLMIDFVSTELTETDHRLLEYECVGGAILFSRNFESADQLAGLIGRVRRLRPDILLAVDHEGGRVWRFRRDFTRLPAMGRLASSGRLSQEDRQQFASLCGWLMAKELLSVGIDFSFAPVLDMDWGRSTVIGDRSFGGTVEQVVTLAGAFMDGMHDAGMAATGKHFPGHGHVEADSHVAIPVDKRPEQDILEQDIRPFEELCERGLDAIMPAHVIYEACDDLPAGFSSFWLNGVLRTRMGFNGVIFSDDLSMAGAKVAGPFPDRAERALEAGCDMVMVCNSPDAALVVADHLERCGVKDNPRLARMRGKGVLPDAHDEGGLEALRATPEWREKQRAFRGLADRAGVWTQEEEAWN